MSGNTKEETEQQFVSEAPVEGENGKKRTVFRGELALFITVMINSFGVVLMLYSGCGNFRNLQCTICIFRGGTGHFTWHLDLYFSGSTDLKSDDHAQKICSGISVQLCGRICIQRAFGFA